MTVRILQGDCRDVLRTLPDASVQCCVTSPPYYGLRDYGVSGQIGLEQTPAEYIGEMVAVFREVRRALRDDGTLWLNIGDCYASSGEKKTGRKDENQVDLLRRAAAYGTGARKTQCGGNDTQRVRLDYGLKPKDLIGIPWMLAFALRDDGWWLRQDNVWGKPNGMPESCTDRTTRAHEYVFLLSKSATYCYDHEAVRTAPKPRTQTQLAKPYLGQSTKDHEAAGVQDASDVKRRIVDKARKPPSPKYLDPTDVSLNNPDIKSRYYDKQRDQQIAEGGNLRSVWWISPAQYSEAHFAVMPNDLAEICIRAGCPEGGTVLDPFGGAGTTGLVADRLRRDAVLVEINSDYCEMIRNRLIRDAGLLADVEEA